MLICSQASPAIAYSYYRHLRKLLQNWRFVLATPAGNEIGTAVNRSFSGGAVLRSAFAANGVFVLDEIIACDMDRGRSATYAADWSISLDTQALSCIQPFLENRVSKLPCDFEEIFMFLAREEVNFDWLPYAFENIRNVRQERNRASVYRKVRGYEVLRSIDAAHLRRTGQVRSKFTESELDSSARAMVDQMITWANDTSAYMEFTTLRRVLFCVLLKMVLIQLSHPRRSLGTKMISLLEFMDGQLASILTGEAILATAYFAQGQSLDFFRKVQIKKPDLLSSLDGIAWDLFHIRQMVSAMRDGDVGDGAQYFFPAILTFDKALAEIIDFYSLRACAIGPDQNDFYTVQHIDLRETLQPNLNEREQEEVEHLFSEGAIEERLRSELGQDELDALIRSLAEELATVCSCRFENAIEDVIQLARSTMILISFESWWFCTTAGSGMENNSSI